MGRSVEGLTRLGGNVEGRLADVEETNDKIEENYETLLVGNAKLETRMENLEKNLRDTEKRLVARLDDVSDRLHGLESTLGDLGRLENKLDQLLKDGNV